MKNVLTKSLNTKLIALFLIAALIPIIAVSISSYSTSSANIQEQTEGQLISLVKGRAQSLQIAQDMQIKQLKVLATNGIVQSAISQYNDLGFDKASSDEKIQDRIAAFKTDLGEFTDATGGKDGFHDLKFIGSNGQVFFAENTSIEGKDYSQDIHFIQALKEPFITYEKVNEERITTIGVPVLSENADGDTMGVIIGTLSVKDVDAILFDHEGLKETGETYLVGPERVMITPSRFSEGKEFTQKADTKPVQVCFERNESISEAYPDYRGIQVYGVSFCPEHKQWVLLAEFDVAEIDKPITSLTQQYLIIGGMTLGVVAAFAYFISRSISRPIKSAAQVAQRISQGDLTVQVSESRSKDEVGALIMAEKQMVDNLRQIVSEVQGATQSVSASSQQIAASGTEMNSAVQQIATTVDQISRGSQTQAQNLEKTKQLTEDLTAKIGNLATSASESEKLADKVGILSLKGSESAKEAGQRMNKIIAVTNESAEKVKGLAAKTNEITTVLDVIRQIADQTNLLALNAAIEAARAGEAGRGFAVVADEVRRLAESSAKSSDEISIKLKQIQDDAQNVVLGIETSANEVNQGKQVIDDSLSTLETIASNVKTVSDNVKKLAESANDQVSNAKIVQTNAGEISAVAEENAAATEEASAAVEEQTAQTQEIATASNQMAELAEQLNKTIARFKIDGTSKIQSESFDKTLKLSDIGSDTKNLLTKLVRK